METPEIDSVSWIQPVKEQPLTIRVSTHGDPGKAQYYMWNYKEDWEIRANYMTTCYFDPKQTAFTRTAVTLPSIAGKRIIQKYIDQFNPITEREPDHKQ